VLSRTSLSRGGESLFDRALIDLAASRRAPALVNDLTGYRAY
jgi:hypothetical protein